MPRLKGKDNPNYKHGKFGTKLYKIWGYMMTRCYNKNNSQYKYYGERGIRVCDEWHIYENFYNAMTESYERASKIHRQKITLDRIYNAKGYFIANVRWATMREQNRNKRSNIWHTYRGVDLILADWANIFDIPLSTLWERIYKIGMSFEEAIVYKKFGAKKIDDGNL